MSDKPIGKMTKAELIEELNRRPKGGTAISNCNFDGGDFTMPLEKLAKAAIENAKAIQAIANVTGRQAPLLTIEAGRVEK